MEKINITTKIQLTAFECSECGIVYAIPSTQYDGYLERGGSWYCPNGHSQHFVETEVNRLKHKLDQREAELERTHERLDGALKDITSKKRIITRMRNRVQAGVCTECHRHFENLERHMKTKHSTFNAEGR